MAGVWAAAASGGAAGARLCAAGDTVLMYYRDDARKQNVLSALEDDGVWEELATGPLVADFSLDYVERRVVAAGGRVRGVEKWDRVTFAEDGVFTYHFPRRGESARGLRVIRRKAASAKLHAAVVERYLHASGVARFRGAACVVLHGGQKGHAQYLADVEVLTVDGASVRIPDKCYSGRPPAARSGHTAVGHDECFFIAGGAAHGKTFHDFHQLHLPSLCWREVHIPAARALGRCLLTLHVPDVGGPEAARVVGIGAAGTFTVALDATRTTTASTALCLPVGQCTAAVLTGGADSVYVHMAPPPKKKARSAGDTRCGSDGPCGTVQVQAFDMASLLCWDTHLRPPAAALPAGLPEDVWGIVAGYCAAPGLQALLEVCDVLRRVASEDALWGALLPSEGRAAGDVPLHTCGASGYERYRLLSRVQRTLAALPRTVGDAKASKKIITPFDKAGGNTAGVTAIHTLPGRVCGLDRENVFLYTDKGVPLPVGGLGSLIDACPTTREFAVYTTTNRVVEVYDATMGGAPKEVAADAMPSGASCLRLGPEHIIIAETTLGGDVRVWSRARKVWDLTLAGHDGGAKQILWDPTGQRYPQHLVATIGAAAAKIIQTDLNTNQSVVQPAPAHWTVTACIAPLAPHEVVGLGYGGMCHVDFRDSAPPAFHPFDPHPRAMMRAALAVSDSEVLVSTDNPGLYLWDRRAARYRLVHETGGAPSLITGCCTEEGAYPDTVAVATSASPDLLLWARRDWRDAPSSSWPAPARITFSAAAVKACMTPLGIAAVTHNNICTVHLADPRNHALWAR